MLAVVNASGLGLVTSRGSSGSPGLGQANEQVYVNSTTGNLIIQHSDDCLSAIGTTVFIRETEANYWVVRCDDFAIADAKK